MKALNQCGEKRKAAQDAIDEIRKKKLHLQADMDAMIASADELTENAEKSRKMTCIAKSNSLRRAAKDKMGEIKALEEHLQNKLKELKDIN